MLIMAINFPSAIMRKCLLKSDAGLSENTGYSKKSLCDENSVYSKNLHPTDYLKMTITEYIRNVDRAILNTVFENTVRRVNKCWETGGGHFEHYL
jgi:hypothetical protein